MGKMLSMEILLLEPFVNIYSAGLRKGRLSIVPDCPKEDCDKTAIKCSRYLSRITCPDLAGQTCGRDCAEKG